MLSINCLSVIMVAGYWSVLAWLWYVLLLFCCLFLLARFALFVLAVFSCWLLVVWLGLLDCWWFCFVALVV